MNNPFSLLNNQITILVLDYNRPDNLKMCLESVKRFVKVKHEVITLINGGVTDASYSFFNSGLTDKLLLSSKNEGSSLGVLRLIKNCTTNVFLFLQSDNCLKIDIDDAVMNNIYNALHPNSFIGAIDLTGLCSSKISEFSERAFIMGTHFYLSNPHFTGYGTGPFYNPSLDNSEQSTLKWIKENNKFVVGQQPLVIDIGKYGILELPCGGVLKRRADTHQVWVIKTPKEKIECYGLNDEEWALILQDKWIGGTVPKHCEKSAFLFYSPTPDPIEQ